MELPALDHDSIRSPYAEQLRSGFGRLTFAAPLEREFRDFDTAQNLPRARLSMLIALILLLAASGIEMLFGSAPPDSRVQTLRLAILVPLMAAVVVAMYLPSARRWYTRIALAGVTTIGFVATYVSHVASLGGASYLLAGQALVVLYGCLFLGLRFGVATAVGALLAAAHIVIGLVVGLPQDQLWYGCAILGAAGVTSLITTYKLEHALRTNFLERRILYELAERDGMTGLYNRRIFDDYVKRLWLQSRREDERLEIVLVDIDYFKIYNDLYGHQAGDDCLRKVAAAIARCGKRPLDFAARYGGEEFVLVLYGPPDDYARALPEQIRMNVLQLRIPHEGSSVAPVVTVSIGAAVAEVGSARSLEGVIQLADEALYQAKKDGRDRAIVRNTDDHGVETGNFNVTRRRSG